MKQLLKSVGNLKCNIEISNRDKIGTQTCQDAFVVTLMYIAYLCPDLVSVHFHAIPILHFKIS